MVGRLVENPCPGGDGNSVDRALSETLPSKLGGGTGHRCTERRAFIGRWKAGVDVDLNTYVLTARQVVHGVQEEVLRAFCLGKPRYYVETELFEEMMKHAESRQLDGRTFVGPHMVWKRRVQAMGAGAVVPLVAAEEGAEVAPYWVSISDWIQKASQSQWLWDQTRVCPPVRTGIYH